MDYSVTLFFYSLKNSRQGKDNNRRKSPAINDITDYWTEFHETWWSYRYMFLVGPKVFSFVVNFNKRLGSAAEK